MTDDGAGVPKGVPAWVFPSLMLVGLVAVVLGLTAAAGERARAVSSDTLATVNGEPISLGPVLTRLRGKTMGPGDLRAFLDSLIDDELLFQRGVALGLTRKDPIVRQRLIDEMRSMAENEALERAPSEEELKAYYDRFARIFTGPPRVQVSQLYFTGAKVAARDARRRLAGGETWEVVQKDYPDKPPLDLAGTPTEVTRFAEVYGPAFGELVRTRPVGAVEGPIKTALGYHVVRIDRREEGIVQPFEVAKERVDLRYRRYIRKLAVQRYLTVARQAADVWQAPDAVDRLLASGRSVP